jgi:hypothetical protein
MDYNWGMTPLTFCIVVLPLSVYLVLLGWLHLRRCPFVTTTGRDLAILAVAVSGLILVGPMELFFPENAVARFGPYVWLMLLAFYGLSVSMMSMIIRPGLVMYNAREDQIRPVLADVLNKLDRPHWSGENVRLPNLKIHFQIEASPWLRTVQLTSSGRVQSLSGWRQLELELKSALQSVPAQASGYGPLFIGLALLLNLTSIFWMSQRPSEVMAELQQILRI